MYTGLYPTRNGAFQNHSAVRPGVKSIPHYLHELGYVTGLLGKRHIKPIERFPFTYLEEDSLDAFIRSETPYLLIITPDEPHAPPSMTFESSVHYAPKEIPLPAYLVDTPETRIQRTGYYDLIGTLDERIGDVISRLEQAGRFDDTVFIYASDHGAGFPFEKWTCYEAGLKIPFIVRWPGVVQPGTTSDAMISLVDVLPTFVEIAGGTPPDSLDGRSFLGVMKGSTDHHRDYIFGTHTTTGIIEGSYFPIRSVRNDRFKYIRNLNPSGTFTNLITNRTGQGGWNSWKALASSNKHATDRVRLYQQRPAEELYDLTRDPYELHNLASDQRFTTTKSNLSQILETWMHQLNDPELAALRTTP